MIQLLACKSFDALEYWACLGVYPAPVSNRLKCLVVSRAERLVIFSSYTTKAAPSSEPILWNLDSFPTTSSSDVPC